MKKIMKKQTAVIWLEKEFVKLESTIGVHGVMYELIEQAKEIEKQIAPITPEALIELGFKKQYADRKDGFWLLDSQKFYFTIDFKTMTPSIHLKGYGHIQKLTNATTIEDIKHLIRLFA